MDVKTKNGVVITEKMFEELAAAYESGNWPGMATGEIVMGRPRLSDEESKTVTFRLPLSKIEALDKAAAANDCSRSDALRKAVDIYLKG